MKQVKLIALLAIFTLTSCDLIIEKNSNSASNQISTYEEICTLSNSINVTEMYEYDTGNYGYFSQDGIGFEYYRAYRNFSSSDFTTIIDQDGYYENMAIPGAIYNTTPLDNLFKAEVTYRTNGEGLVIATGTNRTEMEKITLPSSSSYVSKAVNFTAANYISFETIDDDVHIKEIKLYYGRVNRNIVTYTKTSSDYIRLNPIQYEGTLVSGESYVEVPISIEVSDNSYQIKETKRYTYYSYDYVLNNQKVASVASYINPIDVAIYFTAFKTYPANYVSKSAYSTAKNIFGTFARCVSEYSRTDGYATSVPYRPGSNNKPHYYECDIALDSSYSSSNRGVGRLVVFEYGFDEVGYDNAPVAVYTDDHYATFIEYLNNGTWGERFNAELNKTGYVYGTPTTL